MGRLTSAVRVALACALLVAPLGPAYGYEVEPDSAGNSIYILLRNTHPTAVFSSVSLGNAVSAFVTQATASLVPGPIPASGSDLAALEFDVAAGVALGTHGEVEIRVSGTADGKPVTVVLSVPLVVSATAPVAQGVVGVGVPVPDVGGADTDADGVTDATEVAFGSDPSDPASLPGLAVVVPSLHGLGAGLLGALLLVAGIRAVMSRRLFVRSHR